MTIKIIYNYSVCDNWSIDTFKKVTKVEYEDQTTLDNGQWLHITIGKETFSVEFDPTKDVFVIRK